MRLLAAMVAATLNAAIGAYLLLMAHGVFLAMLERGTEWEGSTPLPSYPLTSLVLYLTLAIVLQFVSGWLLMPRASRRDSPGFWGQYTTRVVLCFGGCLVAAFVMLATVMALLDGGVI